MAKIEGKREPTGTAQEWFEEVVAAVPDWIALRGGNPKTGFYPTKPTTAAFQLAAWRLTRAASECYIAWKRENRGSGITFGGILDALHGRFDEFDSTASQTAVSQVFREECHLSQKQGR